MVTSKAARKLALALDGTVEAPHFERIAFKVVRNYATLAADGKTLNLKLDPGEQELKCMMSPGAFAPVPNAWGAPGWTKVELVKVDAKELGAVLKTAHAHASRKGRARRAEGPLALVRRFALRVSRANTAAMKALPS